MRRFGASNASGTGRRKGNMAGATGLDESSGSGVSIVDNLGQLQQPAADLQFGPFGGLDVHLETNLVALGDEVNDPPLLGKSIHLTDQEDRQPLQGGRDL